MELTAVIEALRSLSQEKNTLITIHTDSRYVLRGATEWLSGWSANGWKTKTKEDVLNKDLWVSLQKEMEGKTISWVHVHGHVGVSGNERCDEIATSFADETAIVLYKGSVEGYSVDLSVTKQYAEGSSKKKSTRKGIAYSYVSEVKGRIMTHDTWKECEDRVRGVSGARFKKAMTKEEEADIINQWKQ